jgi:hypothetical protein
VPSSSKLSWILNSPLSLWTLEWAILHNKFNNSIINIFNKWTPGNKFMVKGATKHKQLNGNN